MKLFIAFISLLFGIIIGAGITTFLAIKKNPQIQKFLCSPEMDYGAASSSPAAILNNAALNNIDINKVISEIKNSSSKENQILITSGPGGCKSEDECLKYCSNLEHLQECIKFAKENLGTTEKK